MILKDLIMDLNEVRVVGPLNTEIVSIHYDSRQVEAGSLFFCIEGYKEDGHDYAVDAVGKGAQVVVINRDILLPDGVIKVFVPDTRLAMGMMAKAFFGRPSEKMCLIGVTGTNGKTTTTYLVKSILEQWGKKVGLIGTITNLIGDRKLASQKTTPESMDLHKLFRDMIEEDVEVVVMEVSSHSLQLKRVVGCTFNVGIYTNLTQDHLDFHITLENYRNAKAKLFEQSLEAIINVDDESGRVIKNQIKCPVRTYGIQEPADIYARDLEITAMGVSFVIYHEKKPISIHLKTPGIFSVYNAMGAAAACLSLGVPAELIQKGLESVRGVSGRFERLETGTDYSVILDYAHTPDGLENILKTAKGMTKGRIITLFGCGGDRDAFKRPIMGEIAGRYSDHCIVTSDNPRTEDPMRIISDIIPGIKKTACPYVVIENRREAIAYALENCLKEDVLILAGKGHETYQLIQGMTYPFDEKEIVAEILGREKV